MLKSWFKLLLIFASCSLYRVAMVPLCAQIDSKRTARWMSKQVRNSNAWFSAAPHAVFIEKDAARHSDMNLIVRLWLHPDCDIGHYEQLEREAGAVLKSHGARIERAFRAAQAHEAEPFEIHFVHFPDEAAFAAYRDDPCTRALNARREALIARTEIWRGEEVIYGF